ncbi:hypothetical protein BC941DRAFT_438633 [Chlamydoabsidia padenii]|nr:hypothetical protein BC941DRAFT_438633 [Chlamydoabsidia padenii]
MDHSCRSRHLPKSTTSNSHRQHAQYSTDNTLDDTIVEKAVLHHHDDHQDKVYDSMGQTNSLVFDNKSDKLKARQSIGALLSRKTSKHNDLIQETSDFSLSEAGLYHIYLTQENENLVPGQQLLSEDQRQYLATILETTGWWVDCLKPNIKEMHILSKLLQIHPLTIQDILSNDSCEKIELFPNYTFVSISGFNIDQETNHLRPYNFYNLVFKKGLLTFYFSPSPHPARIRRRLNRIKQNMLIVPDWIHYALIDDVTDSFAPIITQIELETISIDELSLVLHKSERFDMLKRISRCRKRTAQVSRLLTTKADVMKSLIKRYDDKWQRAGGYGALLVDNDSKKVTALKTLNEVLLHLGDIQDHLITMLQNINHYNRILARAHINYLAQVNVDLSLTYRTTNTVMNRLTFLGTVFIPIIFVAGLWGMNVQVPGQSYLDDIWFHWIVIGMIGYSTLVTYFGHRWKVL